MNKIHKEIYYWLLVIYASSVVWSVFMMTLMPILLLVHWLVSGNWAEKWERMKTRRSIWFTAGLFLLYSIGLLYSSDISNGWKLSRFLLPSFIGALVVGTSDSLSSKQIKQLFLIYILSVALTAAFNLFRFVVLLPDGSDIRQMSRFMSHIRYSLFIDMAIFTGIYYLLHNQLKRAETIFLIVCVLWMVVFLFLLQSFTGIILFFVIGFGLVVFRISKKMRKAYILAILALLLLPLGYVGYVIRSEYVLFYERNPLPKVLPQFTARGNAYLHDTTGYMCENGNLVNCFLCESELAQAWGTRSKIDYNGVDFRKQYMGYTIQRYLTSKGLPKDAQGVAALCANDIENIENGYTNYLYTNELSFRSRVRNTLWQFEVYKKENHSDGSSLVQRIEFYRCATAILCDNPLFGVGTGDGMNTMKEYYPKTGSSLNSDHWLDSHNQFFNSLVAFGIVGTFLIAVLLGATVWYEASWRQYLFVVFFVMLFLSMMVEDTLNTFAGATFFSLFWTIFVFALPSPRNANTVIEQ